MHEEIEILPNGAKQSKLAERLDLVPPTSLLRLGRVLAFGASKYGDDNWHGIPTRSHLNHLVKHVYLYLKGDTTEDHLGHALCRAAMAVWSQENNDGEIPDVD